jgi:diguanylate cyclase (GGDEF)-like protein
VPHNAGKARKVLKNRLREDDPVGVEIITCRDDAERGRLLDLSRRLRGIERVGTALLIAAALISAPTFGWLAILPPLPGLALFWVIQRRLDRYRHPERVLLACVALTQAGMATALALAHGPSIYLLPLMTLLVVLASVVFPVRMAVGVVILTAQLTLAVALGFHLDAVRAAPFTLLYPLALTVAGAGIAMVVAGLDASTRGVAIVDPLTGLPNRIALRARVAELEHQSRVHPRPVAVIVGDPDRFKSINDQRGHAVGDAVLREVAARLRLALGPGGSPYRLGGEEFVAVIVDADVEAAAAAAERVRRAICDRAIEGLKVQMSFGVAASEPGEPFSFRELFGDADRALYEAKRMGGNRARLWPLEGAAGAERRAGAGAGSPAGVHTGDAARVPLGPSQPPSGDGREGASALADPSPLGALAHDAPEGAEEEVTDRWAWWNAKEHAATGNWLVSDELERRQLLELNRRLRERAKAAFLIGFAVGGASAIDYGWQILVPPLVMTVIYVLVEHHIERFHHPEYALGLSWVGLQTSFLLAALIANDQMLFAAPLLLMPLIGSSAVFPPRGVAIGVALTCAIMVTLAFAQYTHLVLTAPGILAYDVVLVIVIGMISSTVGRSTIEYRDLAVVDQLTGLFNRSALMTRVAELTHRARTGRSPVAVVVADIDRFKRINDSFGHATGDLVLQEIGYRIRQNLRAFESAYRIGGEEFVIVLDEVQWRHAENVAARLRQAVAEAPAAGVETTVSVGLAVTAPGEAFDYAALFKRADAALYEAKRLGGDRVCADHTRLASDAPVHDGGWPASAAQLTAAEGGRTRS